MKFEEAKKYLRDQEVSEVYFSFNAGYDECILEYSECSPDMDLPDEVISAVEEEAYVQGILPSGAGDYCWVGTLNYDVDFDHFSKTR